MDSDDEAEPPKPPGPRHKMLLVNFRVIEQALVLVRSQSCDATLEASKKDRRASLAPPKQRPNLDELANQPTFVRQSSSNAGLVMQLTRHSLNKLSTSDFSRATLQVQKRINSYASPASKG